MATWLVILIIGGWTAYCLIRLRSKKNRGCAACASYQAGSCPRQSRRCAITARITRALFNKKKIPLVLCDRRDSFIWPAC